MRGTLVITILTIRSSYLRGFDESVRDGDVADTIQWWIVPGDSWRIRTYAIDHDIHTQSIGSGDGLQELALANAQKHYGDVIRSHHIVELADCLDPNETARAFEAVGLEPRIEVATGRFAFWKPDNARYQTQSEPVQ
jgi:hypothetical protein